MDLREREPGRPDPEELLRRLQAEAAPGRGRLRIYLGAAPGVGKTYAMLQEAHRRKARGTDVVAGLVETHGRPRTAEQIGDLEVIPPQEIPYRGIVLREMDVDAVLARRPRVVLVDELAHTNAPGSRHTKRWEDVQDLLNAGIDVVSTLNIQHIESMHEYVEQMTGVDVHETVPDSVVDQAEQVELIDMAPEALVQRMKHGNIYPPEQAQRALENFFTAGNLIALRDLALRATAREVEGKLAGFMSGDPGRSAVAIGDRVMVAIDHHPRSKALIRRGWRMAAALKGELVVVYVEPAHSRRQVQTLEDERQLRANLQLADELGARVVRLRGSIADELAAYARANHVATLVIGHPSHGRWEEWLHGSVTAAILRKMRDIDVHVVADQGTHAPLVGR